MAEVSLTPTASLTITDPEHWEAEARSFAAELAVRGERPWFEIRWPAPATLTEDQATEWLARQEDAYDAVELIGDAFVTLPPYSELRAEG